MSKIPARQVTASRGQYGRSYLSLVPLDRPQPHPGSDPDPRRRPDDPSKARAAARSASPDPLSVIPAPRDRLSIIPTPLADQLAIRAIGELDLSNAAALADALEAASRSHRSVLLDVSEISFMDRFALRVIVQAHVYLRHSGGRLVLRVRSLQVRRLLAVTGEERVLEIIEDPGWAQP